MQNFLRKLQDYRSIPSPSIIVLTLIAIFRIIFLNGYCKVIKMDYMTLPAAIAQEHGGIIETKTVIAHGISKAMLYKLCREDKIHRAVQGQYILPDDMQDKLLSISMRSHQIILSHEFFTIFQIGRSLSIRSQRRPIIRCRPQSKKKNARSIASNGGCSISAGLRWTWRPH